MIILRDRLRLAKVPRSFKGANHTYRQTNSTPTLHPSLIRFHSMISAPASPTILPFNDSSLIQPHYTHDNVLEVLDGTSVLRGENSFMREVVVRYTDEQLKKLKASLGESKDTKIEGEIKETLEYMNNLIVKLKDDAQTEQQLKAGLSPEVVVYYEMIRSPKFFSNLFRSEVRRLLDSYYQDENKISEDFLIQEIISLMDTTWRLSSLIRPGWKPRFEEKALQKISPLLMKSSHIFDFYKRLLDYDSFSVSDHSLRAIRGRLRNGSARDRYLYGFGQMFDSKDKNVIEVAKTKFVKLYSSNMIRQITTDHINKGDEKAKTYIELLVRRTVKEVEKCQNPEEVKASRQRLYETVMYYSTTMGNYQNSLLILDQMQEKGIELSSKMFHILLTSLRKKKLYDGVLMLLRDLPQKFQNDVKLRHLMANELFVVLRKKFPDKPVMVLSHYITIFNNSEILLNELGILSLLSPMKSATRLAVIDDKSLVVRAKLPEYLKLGDVYPSFKTISELYSFTLNYVSKHHQLRSVKTYNNLFTYMMKHATLIQSNEASNKEFLQHPFSSINLEDSILQMFVRRVLIDFKRPSLALNMVERFLSLKFKRFDPTILTYIFYHHSDHSNLPHQKLIEMMEKYKAQPNFPYIAGQIFKNMNRGDPEIAKKWYTLLCAWKYPIESGRLIRLVEKCEWGFPDYFDPKSLDVVLDGEKLESLDLELYEAEDDEVHDEQFVASLNDILKKAM